MFFNKKNVNEDVAGDETPKTEGTWKRTAKKWLKRAGLVAGGGLLAVGGWKCRGLWDSVGKAVVDAVPDALPEVGEAVIDAATEAAETVVEEQL